MNLRDFLILYTEILEFIQRAAERRSRHRAWPKKQKNTIQKTTKKASKINPKSIKNGPKIDQKSPKIEVWRRLGGVLGGLGASWNHFRVSWEV